MPDNIIARIEITMNDEGRIDVEGSGVALRGATAKVFGLGLIELAKDIIRGDPRRALVAPPN